MLISISQKSKLLSEFVRLNIVSNNSKEADEAYTWFNTLDKKQASFLIGGLIDSDSREKADLFLKSLNYK